VTVFRATRKKGTHIIPKLSKKENKYCTVSAETRETKLTHGKATNNLTEAEFLEVLGTKVFLHLC
jgi:hypothetical protein